MDEKPLTEKVYHILQSSNQQHGRILFCDLYVAESFSHEIHLDLPKDLPTGVQPSWEPHFIAKEEKIEGIEDKLHVDDVWYTRNFDEEGKLISIRKHHGSTTTQVTESLGSHYHVSSLRHNPNSEHIGLGKTVMSLGQDLNNYDDVLNAMHRELPAYNGELEEEAPKWPHYERPQKDLGISMLRSFTMGFLQGARDFGKTDVAQRSEDFLDRFPS